MELPARKAGEVFNLSTSTERLSYDRIYHSNVFTHISICSLLGIVDMISSSRTQTKVTI